ncbi:MAG TPA: hypothetical protein VEX37_11015 [Thermomicrobiales bacterium]|nr:hypothetical protein [Thermomicrobiales bacterium]
MIARSRVAEQRHSASRIPWTFPRRMLEDHLALSGLLWLGLLVVVIAIAVGNAIWGSVGGSYWDDAVSSIPQWYVAFMAGFLAYSFLPALIAHGQTRREFGQQALIYSVVFSAALALLVIIGFGVEAAVFAVMDWPHGIDGGHLFTSSGQVHLIFAEFLMRFLVWSSAGFLVGAGFYRSEEAGGGALAVAWIPVAITEMALGTQYGSPIVLFRLVWEPPTIHPLIVLAIGVAAFAVTVWMAWKVVRDIPIRSKST